jgi:HAD superfamily hydrolase (TIGR01450 family)
MNDVPEITIDVLLDRYAALLVEAYGVLVHSSGALPGADEFIARLNRAAKPYWILTNDASRLPATAAAHYRSYGIAVEQEAVITSGSLLAPYFAAQRLHGARCVVLGPEDSAQYVAHAGGRLVLPGEAFDVLVIADESGYPLLETADATLTALFNALDRGNPIHLLLPNPDTIYPTRGHGFGFASGSVAAMFEAALRARYPNRRDLGFARLGKPHEAMFKEALRRSGTRDMVVIGDQVDTDVRGARAFGLDCTLVSNGVTALELMSLAPELRPTHRLRSLA